MGDFFVGRWSIVMSLLATVVALSFTMANACVLLSMGRHIIIAAHHCESRTEKKKRSKNGGTRTGNGMCK